MRGGCRSVGSTLTKVAIGAAIVGAAFLTGGVSLLPSIAATSTTIAGVTVATAAIGAGLATTALGSLALMAGASIALSGVSQALAKKPSVSPSQIDRLNASLDPNAPRRMWFGSTAGGTDIRYVEPSGTDQEYIDYIIGAASHAATSIDEVWFEDLRGWSLTGGAEGKYQGYLWITPVLEGSATNFITINDGSKWGSTRRLTGCAYLHVRIKRTGNTKKAQSPFSGGLPGRITVVGNGAPMYDPRRDSTVPGGSGPMRATDQSTWRYVVDDGIVLGENHALQLLWYLLGWRINGRLAVGRGADPRRIDLASFAVAASLCDEPVTRADGTTHARYAGAGMFSEGDDPGSVLNALTLHCNGRLRDGSGKLALAIMHNDLATAAADDGLTEDDVIGSFVWNPEGALDQTPNIVRGKYTDPSAAALYQLVPYPEIAIPSVDGNDRILQLDLPMCEDPGRAQRIAKQTLQRRQYARSFSAPFSERGWKYQVGQLLPFSFAPLKFDRVLFRVEKQKIGLRGTCEMVLTIEHPAIYAWDREERAAVRAADPVRYDGLNAPILLALAEAATAADVAAAVADVATNESLAAAQDAIDEQLAELDRRVRAIEPSDQEP